MIVNQLHLNETYRLAFLSGKVNLNRLAKALTLVDGTTCQYAHIDLPHHTETRTYLVPGTEQAWYSITVSKAGDSPATVGSCDCKDHTRNHATLCKHMLAVMLITRARELEYTAKLVAPAIEPTYRERMLKALYGEVRQSDNRALDDWGQNVIEELGQWDSK